MRLAALGVGDSVATRDPRRLCGRFRDRAGRRHDRRSGQHVLRPARWGTGSRLHVRVLFEGPRLVARALALGDLVMMRKQLITVKSLAEREAAAIRWSLEPCGPFARHDL